MLYTTNIIMDEDSSERYKAKCKYLEKYKGFFKNDEEFDFFVRLPLKMCEYPMYLRNMWADRGIDVDPAYKFTTAEQFESDMACAISTAFDNEELNLNFN